MEELKVRCGFLTAVMYSLFIELFLDEKGSMLRPFQGKEGIGSPRAQALCKNPILWDRSAYDMLCLNDFKPFFEPAKSRCCYLKECLLLFFPLTQRLTQWFAFRVSEAAKDGAKSIQDEPIVKSWQIRFLPNS